MINDQISSDSLVTSAHYSSLSRRLIAFLLDSFFLFILCVIGAHVIPVLGGIIIWFFYAPILESSALRATLGKHLVGIQVVDEMGRRISFRSSFIRNFTKIISSVFLFIGFIVAMFTARKQALHDLFADTFVVYGRNETPVPQAWLDEVKELFNFAKNSIPAEPRADAASSGDALAQLERLQVLRDKGTLTEEEFQAAKRKILGEI